MARAPAPDSGEGTPFNPVFVRFSESLDPSSSSTVQAEFEVGGSSVQRSISLSEGSLLTLTHATPFPLRSRVQVRLTGQVKDIAGNVLSLDGETWTFFVPTFEQVANLSYQQCGMQLRGRETWLSDCYGLVLLFPDGGTGPRIGPAGYVDHFFVEAPPGEMFVFAETGFFGTTRSTQLFQLDAGGASLDPVVPPLIVDPEGLSGFVASDPAHPVAALQTTPKDGGVGEVQLFQWSGTAWSGLTVPITGRLSYLREAQGSLYAYFEPAPDNTDGTFRVESDGGWAPVGPRFPVFALGLDANGALIRSRPQSSRYALDRWSGTDWVPIGDSLPDLPVRFAFDSHNRPVVATVSDGSFAVRRLTAEGWRVIGQPFATLFGFQFNIFITFDPDDRAVVAWSDESRSVPAVSFVAREVRE